MGQSRTTLQAGIARHDITPSLGTVLFGYPLERLGFEVADGLNVTALVIKSDSETTCIISLDVCLIEEEDVAAIRHEIESVTAIPAPNITICATHTHSAPITVNMWGWGAKDQTYLDFIRPLIARTVAEAKSSLQSVRVGIGSGHTDTGINRREVGLDGKVTLGFNEWGPRDKELTVLRFESENGPLANLVHLSAHPTSRGLEASISRDWPGVMMDRMEHISGVPVLFINGAFGDVAPRTNVGGSFGHGSPESIEIGLRAATDALAVWRGIKEFRDLDLEIVTGTIKMPYAPLPTIEEAETELKKLEGYEHTLGHQGAEWKYWNAVVQANTVGLQHNREWHQTITRLGPVVIVPFAGEIFSVIALRLRKASPYSHTLCAGTTNGSHGYYVTREERARGGYEAWVAKAYSAYVFAEHIDDVLVQENMRLLKMMA